MMCQAQRSALAGGTSCLRGAEPSSFWSREGGFLRDRASPERDETRPCGARGGAALSAEQHGILGSTGFSAENAPHNLFGAVPHAIVIDIAKQSA